MDLKNKLSTKNQSLLGELGIVIEDKDYSKEEIKYFENEVFTHIMSKSSKNNEISNELNKYNELANILIDISK